jgi:hypothetical protein
MFYGTFAFLCWKNRQKQHLKFLGISFLSSILLARLLFCGFFYGFSCGRAGKAFGKFNPNVILRNFFRALDIFHSILQNHLFYRSTLWAIFFMALLFPILREKDVKCHWERPLFIIMVCILWSFGATFLAPFDDMRYIIPCFPLLSLAVPFIASFLRHEARVFFSIVISFGCLLALGSKCCGGVCYLFRGHGKQYEIFTKKVDVPVFVFVSDQNAWKYSALLPYLADSQRYQFPRSKAALEKKLQNLSRAIVLFSDDYSFFEEKKKIVSLKSWKISDRWTNYVDNFMVLELIRKE